MTKFTPGPWKVRIIDSQYGGFRVMEAQDKERNWLFYNKKEEYSRDEREANARLIAAAPEMYDLLKNFLSGPHWAKKVNQLINKIDGEDT